MKVSEIFTSVEGEAFYSGLPTTFVRFHGCSVGCKWCDTKQDSSVFNSVTPAHILNQVCNNKVTRISITGGNPMEQDFNDLQWLLKVLAEHGKEVNVEHPGVWLNSFEEREVLYYANQISFDIKPPSACINYAKSLEVLERQALETFEFITHNVSVPFVQLKCVVDTDEDLEFYKRLFRDYYVHSKIPIYMQVCDSKRESMAQKVINELISGTLPDHVRIGAQLHKTLRFR